MPLPRCWTIRTQLQRPHCTKPLQTAAETAAEDDRLASLASAKKARAEKKAKAAAAVSEKKQKAVDQAAAEEKRIAAVKKEKEASDARRANNINARDACEGEAGGGEGEQGPTRRRGMRSQKPRRRRT